MSKSKQLGTMAETAVVNYALTNGFPGAERRALRGTKDIGDVLLADGVIVSVKGGHMAEKASDNQVLGWLRELDKQVAHHEAVYGKPAGHGIVGLLVLKRAGVGYARAGDWWCVEWIQGEGGRYPTWARLKDTLRDLRTGGWA